MHSIRTGRAMPPSSPRRMSARLLSLLLLSFLLSAIVPTVALAAGQASQTPPGPPMNSVSGLTRYIAMLKTKAHLREVDQEKREAAEAKADKAVGRKHVEKHDRDRDNDRDRDHDRDADRDREAHRDGDHDRDADAPKLKTIAAVKAAPKASHAKPSATAKPHKAEKPGEEDEDEDGTDYLEAYLFYLKQRAFPNDSVDWDAYTAAAAQRDQMDVAPFAGGAVHANTPASYERWEFVGPRNLAVPYRIYYGNQVLSGRVNGLAFDPTAPGTYYLAAASGGAWKSVDSGVSWTPLSDTWTAMQCSTVTLDPINSQVVYIGTGDYDGQNGAGGFGVMKSTDGGLTWTQYGSEFGRGRVSALVVDPANPNILVATTGRGDSYRIWRSVNAGQNWANVSGGTQSNWSDLVIGAPDVNGLRYYYACGNAGGKDQFWRSADRGATWTHLTAPAVKADSLPRLAASVTDPNMVYFGSSNDNKIYKSIDAGATFVDSTNDLPGDYNWSQSFYDFRLTATSFTNAAGNAAEAVYASLIDLDQTINGGANWQSLGRSYQNSSILHNDQHSLAINPNNPNDILVGCDGGAYRLVYQPANNTWTFATMNGTLGTTLFYHGAWSATDPARMLGGTQDNATPQSGGNLNQWNNRGGGDGGFSLIDPTNDNNQYTTSQNLSIYHTANNWANTDYPSSLTPNDFNGENRAFIAPIALDPSNPHLMYAGTDHLWRYHDQTRTWDADLGAQKLTNETLSWIAVAPSDSNRLYTGGSDGQLWMSANAGATWTQINTGTPSLPGRYITAIDVNPTNPSDILVGLSGNGAGHLYRCVDTTLAVRVWGNVSGAGVSGLPNVSLNSVTRDIDDTQATFYAATDIGVFYTADGGATWTNATEPLGLPNVQVNEIKAVPGTRFLNVATFGRGMWRIQLPSVVTPGLAITSLSPNTASAGAPGFTLTVTGTGFVAGSTVNWNNRARATQFVSATSLTATIPASDIVTAGPDYVTVSNSPTVVSNALTFTVSANAPTTTATYAGPVGTNGWYTGDVTVTLSATSPSGAGNIAATYYTVDGGPQQTYTVPFVVTGDGIHALTFWSVDRQANEETPHKTGTVKIDSVPVVLTFGTATPAANSAGWNNGTVTLPYTAQDVTSGVAATTPGSPVSFATEGRNLSQTVHTVDVAGNAKDYLSSDTVTTPINIDLTAPTTTGTEADGTAGATYTLTATDALSGVAATYYTVDGAQSTYTVPFTVSGVGSHTVTFWSVDVAGNVEAAHTVNTAVNPKPYLGALAPSTAQVGGPDLTLKATGSGFLSTSVVDWNGTPLATTYVSPTELDAVVPAADTAAVARVGVTVVTPAPGGGTSNALTFLVTDAHIPVTTATVDGPGGNGRYRADVTVTLAATDADGNLAGTFYALDAAGTKPYTAPFVITGVGSHTVTYWSTDTSGNEEAHHTLSLVIDTAGPATTLTLSGQAVSNGWYKDTVTATLAATDPDGADDVAATYYSLDGGGRQAYTAPVAITGEGTHALAYWSVDRAGNEETPHKTATVKIDGVAPALAFGAATPAPNAAGWNNTAVSIPFTTSDATSGVATAAPGGPVTFSAEGRSQTASVTVTDVAGNGASFTTPAVSIDLTAPATTGVLGNGQVTLAASDGLSGVAATYYTLDGGARQAYSAPVALGEGGHTVTFWSVDIAGNTEGAHTLSTTVAPTGPVVLHTFPTGVQMFSIPRDLSAAPSGMDYVPSPLFVWSPTLTQYIMSAGGSAASLQSGTAYWGRFKHAGRLYDMGKKTDTSKPFSIALKAGWNMVGMPFEDGVAVKTLVILDSAGVSHDFAAAAASGLVSYNLYSYPAGSSAYTVLTAPGGTLDPYLGYWVHASKDVTLLIPPPTNRVPL